MPRHTKRPRYLLWFFLAVAATLVLLPESYGWSLRSQALSLCKPVLGWFSKGGDAGATASASRAAPNGTSPRGDDGKSNEEADRLRAELVRLQEENRQLRAQAGAAALPAEVARPKGASAKVIARQTLGTEPLLGLDRGLHDGVKKGDGVLFRGAVAGRVVSSADGAACMALVTHPGVTVSARLSEGRVEGVLSGGRTVDGERLCVFKAVGAKVQARPGEAVVTSGLDGSFPPGCWIGTVVSSERKGDLEWQILVRPAVSGPNLEAVFVVQELTPAEVPWPAKKK